MQKFPLLEMLRAENARRDAAITAPVRQELAQCGSVAESLRASLRSLEQFVGREIAKHVIEHMGHEIGSLVRRSVIEAVMKSGARPGEPVHIMLDPMNVHMLDERSLERTVLNQYLDQMPHSLGVQALRHDARATVLDIRLPAFGCRQVIADAA